MARSSESYIRRRARRYGIDPNAAIAVALGEGGLVNRADDVGDRAGGGSYGPFQLYAQGALPSQYRGNPTAADTWAWSPAGIDHALQQMAKAGAKGLSGEAAVRAIISKFERPRDPAGSITAALARLGNGAASPGAAGAVEDPSASGPPAPGLRRRFAASLIASNRRATPDYSQVLALVKQMGETRETLEAAVEEPQGGAGIHGAGAAAGGNLAETMLAIIKRAQAMDLSVRENPYTDPVDPVHTKGSHHYQTFGGRYGGKKLGRGADISGDPGKEAALFDWIAARYPGIAELIYDPRGSIFGGRRSRKPYGGHQHVHVGL